jgi:hypothetical protein
MLRRFTKKRWAVGGLGAIAALALAAGAYAYFTSTGSNTSSATVGSPSTWTVTPGTVSYTGDTSLTPQSSSCLPLSAKYDGTDGTCAVYETVPYTVKNPSTGNENLSNVVVSITSGTSRTSDWSVTNVNGTCSYHDFAIDGVSGGGAATDATLAADFTPGQSKSGKITVTMVDTNADQNGCQGLTVPLYLYAS